MPTLIANRTRPAAQEYSLSLADLLPSALAHGGLGVTSPAPSAYDPVFRAELMKYVSTTVREIGLALQKFEMPRPSVAELVYTEEPDDAPARQSAFEWKPVSVRIVPDAETGYVGDGDIWH